MLHAEIFDCERLAGGELVGLVAEIEAFAAARG